MIPGVPYDEELEYIESTGTQWIDTGVNTATISKYITDTAMLGVGAEGSNVAPYIFIGIHASNVFYGYVGNSSPTSIPSDNARHIFEAANTGVVANDGFYIDGVKAKDRGTGTVASAPFYLFACYQSGGLRYFLKQKKYAAQIYCNGIITRDFIPVRVNGVAKMYDRVTGTFPAHYGTFVAGPVVARPVMGLHFYPRVYTARDYIQDGLVAMWDGIENAGWGVHDPNATVWKDLVGTNDLTLAQSSSLYFAETYLYASNTQYAVGDISKIPANLNNVTYETCWNRLSKFDESADSNNCYGQMVLDVFENKLWYKCSQQNGGYMNTPPSDVRQGYPFTQSMICQYSGSADTITSFVNGTQISNTILYSSNPQINRVRIGSGWQDPASRHHCVRVYSRALTASEIAHNYNIDKWRFNLT